MRSEVQFIKADASSPVTLVPILSEVILSLALKRSRAMPVTGIPLPFISYGGSNLVTCFIAVGLVQNVRMRRRATKFDL